MLELLKVWLLEFMKNPKERFLNFKTFDAAWQAPAGLVIIYACVEYVQYVIPLYFGARGAQMVYTGLYDFFTNPVKAAAELQGKVDDKLGSR